jgi:hypothetical protein
MKKIKLGSIWGICLRCVAVPLSPYCHGLFMLGRNITATRNAHCPNVCITSLLESMSYNEFSFAEIIFQVFYISIIILKSNEKYI